MRRTWVFLAALVTLAAGACGGDSEVGGDLQATGDTSATSTCRLGECTTTTPPAPTTTAAAAPTTAAPVATTAKPAPTTTAPQAAIVIKIQSDTADGGQFDPRQAGVPRNSIVKWTNADTVPRSVEADNGAFKSPMLQPGASFEYRATAPGTFNYHDGTRPYAVGSLIVG